MLENVITTIKGAGEQGSLRACSTVKPVVRASRSHDGDHGRFAADHGHGRRSRPLRGRPWAPWLLAFSPWSPPCGPPCGRVELTDPRGILSRMRTHVRHGDTIHVGHHACMHACAACMHAACSRTHATCTWQSCHKCVLSPNNVTLCT